MSDLPLISAICPTRGRRHFLKHALELFRLQDYPNKELVIVEDDELSLPLNLDDNMTYTFTYKHKSIGAKRNRACELANGEIIAFFDDDDYYAPNRLSRQAAPILAGEADITGMKMDVVFDVPAWQAWRCSPELHQEIFRLNVHGGTLMFKASLWGPESSFPDISSGEDGTFLRLVRSRGARLARIENNGSFVYVRHESRWPLPPQGYKFEPHWEKVPVEQYIPESDIAFYRSIQSQQHEMKMKV